MPIVKVPIQSEDAMTHFGRHLGSQLKAGDTLLLGGPIGAGKTHLARAIILARLDTAEHVPSPTYTLVQTYEPENGPDIWHADLYRLGDSSELVELGLDEAMGRDVVLVEWPDRLPPEAQPEGALRIDVTLEGEMRVLNMSPLSHRLIATLRDFTDD